MKKEKEKQDMEKVEVKAQGTAADVRKVKISSIVQDPEMQIRQQKLDAGTVSRYAAAYKLGIEMPPVKVAKKGEALVLFDGWHRLAALKRNGESTVQAEVTECEDDKEIRWLAAQANLSHGLPLRKSELRKVFTAYIKAKKYKDDRGRFKSYRDMAKELGGFKSYTTIRNWTKDDFPSLYRQIGGIDPKGGGGMQDREDGDRFEALTAEALTNALATFMGVKDLKGRGKLISQAEEMLKMMRNEDWEPFEEDF